MSLGSELLEAKELAEFYHDACLKADNEVCQVLGQALGGYPWYKDDQKNFPGSTEKDGICTGVETCESMADIAAAEIVKLRKEIKHMKETMHEPGTICYQWMVQYCLEEGK